MRGAGLRDVEVVEEVDVEGDGCVEAGDVGVVDGAVSAEASDDAVRGVGDVPVTGGVEA